MVMSRSVGPGDGQISQVSQPFINHQPSNTNFQFQYQRISRVVGYNSLEKTSVHDLVTCVDVFQMAFADNCSYNVLTKASIHLLNQRLQKPVTASNFRPNIVVEGCPAFAEVRRFAL